MALHGELKVNHMEIGKWEAVRAGVIPGPDNYFIYRCKLEYSDMKGYNHKRTIFVAHRFSDGAIALTGKVMVAFSEALLLPPISQPVAWSDFCENHNLNPYITLD